MKTVGWLLDVYINSENAVLWFKLENGEALRLVDNYTPDFYVEPKENAKAEELASTLFNHPNILHILPEEKFTSVNMKETSVVLHVYVDYARNFRKVVSDLEKLDAIKGYYNLDILHVQRYLFQKGVHLAPTHKVEVKYDEQEKLLYLCTFVDNL